MRDKLKTIIDVRARRQGTFRITVLFLFFTLVSLFILGRMFELQVRDGTLYGEISKRNAMRSIPIPSVRSMIIDRTGARLAVDVPEYELLKLKKNGQWDRETIGFERASKYEESGTPEDQYVEVFPKRVYPAGETTAHITGYLGEIGPVELGHMRSLGYRPGDRIGKSGIEKYYERRINGIRGGRIFAVDSRGRFLRDLSTEQPIGGKPFRTSIDLRLQKEAYAALKEKNKPGAMIVMDSKTGEILVMATYPSFNNNLTSGGLHPELWRTLYQDPRHPLMNRAISVTTPLGSVFKLVIGSAAIREGLVKTDGSRVFHCPGSFRLGRSVFRCWTSHGAINFTNGIAQSCDVVFYTLGRELGVTRIEKYAKMMGFGRKTGVDLPGEAIGLVPGEDWKRHFRGSEWFEGDTISYAIGQGYLQVTPIQAMVMANVVATRGTIVTPHVRKDVKAQTVNVGIPPAVFERIRLGMRQAVLGGTCARFNQFPIPSAGKTGTAQDLPRPNPHAWFVGFAPFDNPRFTYAVFVENGGHGASDALPVALRVMDLALKLGYFGEIPKSEKVKTLKAKTL